jgi:hypothetical protein
VQPLSQIGPPAENGWTASYATAREYVPVTARNAPLTPFAPPWQSEFMATPFPVGSNSHRFGPWMMTHCRVAKNPATSVTWMQYMSTSSGAAGLPSTSVIGPVPAVVCAVAGSGPASPTSFHACAWASGARAAMATVRMGESEGMTTSGRHWTRWRTKRR